MLYILMLISVAVFFIEGIPLMKKKKNKELYTLISLLIIALILGIVKIIGVPTPARLLENLLYPIGESIFR